MGPGNPGRSTLRIVLKSAQYVVDMPGVRPVMKPSPRRRAGARDPGGRSLGGPPETRLRRSRWWLLSCVGIPARAMAVLALVSSVLLLAGEPSARAATAAVSTAPTLSPPPTIPADCSSDVTTTLNQFFAGLPEGATVELPPKA